MGTEGGVEVGERRAERAVSDGVAWRKAHDRQTERAVAGGGVRRYSRRVLSVSPLKVVGRGGVRPHRSMFDHGSDHRTMETTT